MMSLFRAFFTLQRKIEYTSRNISVSSQTFVTCGKIWKIERKNEFSFQIQRLRRFFFFGKYSPETSDETIWQRQWDKDRGIDIWMIKVLKKPAGLILMVCQARRGVSLSSRTLGSYIVSLCPLGLLIVSPFVADLFDFRWPASARTATSRTSK